MLLTENHLKLGLTNMQSQTEPLKQGCSHIFECGGVQIMGPWINVGGEADHTFTIRLSTLLQPKKWRGPGPPGPPGPLGDYIPALMYTVEI